MNDEIKAILADLNLNVYETKEWKEPLGLNQKTWKVLLDYITNLQQENEKLKQPKIFIDTQDMEERYGEELYKDYLEKQVKDYKSRIEKAVEYIEELKQLKSKDYLKLIEPIYVDKLLNILNGRSDK